MLYRRPGWPWPRAVTAGRRLALAGALLWPLQGLAQPAGEGELKRLEILPLNAAIEVDGVMSEPVWQQATLIDDLHQVEPFEFTAPSQRTEIRIFYDADALYVAARLWDSEADNITANVLRQGEGLNSEDRFAIIIDPYLDRRSGYRFQVNANGVRWDALYQDTSSLESNWEGIWRGAATRDAGGWTAEIAIPFKTLSFNPNTADWGINFERTIQRVGETIGWVSRNQQMNPGVAGIASGFAGLQQGRGLDVVPSASVRGARAYGAAAASSSAFEPSVDVFYKLTPSLNAALTVNTDFSATEVDDRQVNLTRFNLFFPEKRDFFLQDADIFEFGRIGGGGFDRETGGIGNPSLPRAAAQNARPFFSRRLGLSAAGQPVDIEYGGKLSGRAGRWNLGALAIRQGESGDVLADDIFVGRVTANVLAESAIGLIVTDGDPQSNRDSTTTGLDFRYRNSNLPGGRLVEGEAWFEETNNENVSGENRAFGYGISIPNARGWLGQFKSRQVEENFDPAVGFIDATGIRDYSLTFGYEQLLQDRWARSRYAGFDGYRSEYLDTGEVQSEILGLRLTTSSNTRDAIFMRLVANTEVLREDFTIYRPANYSPADPASPQPITLAAGRYTFSDWRIGFQSGNQRRIALRGSISGGEFYSGERVQPNVELTWRPSPGFGLGFSYAVNFIDLPEGEFEVRQSSFRTEIVLSSRLSWVTLIQYDNVSESAGINSRLHWIPEAGREGFIVLNHNLADRDRNGSFHSTTADLALKFSYTWRL